MRCERCGYSSPENHRFCGMCGSKLAESANSVVIDDNDPLEIESSAHRLDNRSTSAQEPIEFRQRDRRRELARDTAQSSGSNGRTNYTSATIANLPPDTAQEEVEEEVRSRRPASKVSGIGGPSFLGLGYEGSNSGFVYDKPRNDAFVYDTDSPPPEYLLEEVPRGVSWRAWALFLLLLVGDDSDGDDDHDKDRDRPDHDLAFINFQPAEEMIKAVRLRLLSIHKGQNVRSESRKRKCQMALIGADEEFERAAA